LKHLKLGSYTFSIEAFVVVPAGSFCPWLVFKKSFFRKRKIGKR
jgi:hypothetical protein